MLLKEWATLFQGMDAHQFKKGRTAMMMPKLPRSRVAHTLLYAIALIALASLFAPDVIRHVREQRGRLTLDDANNALVKLTGRYSQEATEARLNDVRARNLLAADDGLSEDDPQVQECLRAVMHLAEKALALPPEKKSNLPRASAKDHHER